MSYQTTYHLNYEAETPTLEDVAAKLAETVDLHYNPPVDHERTTQAWVDILQGEPPPGTNTRPNSPKSPQPGPKPSSASPGRAKSSPTSGRNITKTAK